MSFVVRESFPVRGYEIGFTGTVPPSTIARYCENARWGMFRHDALSRHGRIASGVVRAMTIAYESELTFPNDVLVTTWVARVGRTSLDCAHEIARGDGSVVAVARVTLVAIGPEGPVAFPAGLAEAVDPRPAPAHLELPTAASDRAFESEWVPRPSDQDQFRHVNQAKYVDFADDARHVAATAGHAAGFSGPVGTISLAYDRELHAGEPAKLSLFVQNGHERGVILEHATTGAVVHRAVIVPRTGR